MQWLLFIAALILLFITIQIELIKVAANKLGLSGRGMVVLLLVSLFGSAINMPLFRMRSAFDPSNIPEFFRERLLPGKFPAGQTLVAINIGGAVIPLCFTAYLITHQSIPLLSVVLCTIVIIAISYFFSRPIANLGIGMPILIAPFSAALMASLFAPEQRAALAYISGTLGVLIGADLFRLRDIRQLAVPLASIGGAGTFDGIFLTGLVAVLLT